MVVVVVVSGLFVVTLNLSGVKHEGFGLYNLLTLTFT